MLAAGHALNAAGTRFEYGNHVVINTPLYEDLYVAGGTITINAPVFGDVIIAGGSVVINDSVANDLLIAGGNVTLNGHIGDDIRCVGGNIRVGKNVNGDVVIAGGKICIEHGANVGNLLVSGGNIQIDGIVNGEIKGRFGQLVLNGTALKNVDCSGGRITINGNVEGLSVLAAKEIIIGDRATFKNDVRYWCKRPDINFKHAMMNGKAVYDPGLRLRSRQWYFLGTATVIGMLWLLGMAFTMIFIIQYLFSTTMSKAADTAFSKTVKSFGWGVLFFAGVPVAALATFVTIVGVPVGIFLLFAYIFLFLLATTITSVVTANWINNKYKKNWRNSELMAAALIVYVLLKLATLIPVAGWVLAVLFVCTAFGAILQNIRWRKSMKSPLGDKTMN